MTSEASRDWLPRFAAPAVLVLVACLQLYLAHSHNLSPWKGGGFSMFAAVDRPDHRIVRCYLRTPQGEVPARVTDSELRRKVRAMPTPSRTSRLAQSLARSVWVSDCSSAGRAGSDSENCTPEIHAVPPGGTIPADSSPIAFSRVRLEVWKVAFRSSDRMLMAHKIIEETAERP